MQSVSGGIQIALSTNDSNIAVGVPLRYTRVKLRAFGPSLRSIQQKARSASCRPRHHLKTTLLSELLFRAMSEGKSDKTASRSGLSAYSTWRTGEWLPRSSKLSSCDISTDDQNEHV